MTKLQELARTIDGLDEDGPNYREVKAAKRMVHDLIAEEAGK